MPLQITVNQNKVLKQHILDNFFQKHPTLEHKWYGIVRPTMALRKRSFSVSSASIGRKRTSVSEVMDVDESSEEIPHVTVQQYVIPFPAHQDPLDGFTPEEKLDLITLRRDLFTGFSRASK